MKETNTEFYLRNINEKLANFNKFIWFRILGGLIALPLFIFGLVFQSIALTSYASDLMSLSILFYAAALVVVLVFFIIALVSLCKSTKNTEE